MKIGIIGDHEGIGALIAAELAKRYVPEEVEVVVIAPPDQHTLPIEDEATTIGYWDALFDIRPEPIVIPIVMRPVEPWPETINPGRSRYNRKPKWRQNQSGSKYF